MWNFLKGLFVNGGLLPKIGALATLLLFGWVILALSLNGGQSALASAIVFGGLVWKKIGNPVKDTLGYITTVPYWGSKFGIKNCIRLLAEDRMKPYIMRNGRKSKTVLISKSGRWFSVKGRYYPTYLVYDYNRATGVMTMIDGTRLDELPWENDPSTNEAITDLLGTDRIFRLDDEIRFRVDTTDCARAFSRAFKGSYEQLARADWDQVRYNWERELTAIMEESLDRRDEIAHADALRDPDIARDALYNRVLIEKEINEIANAIKDGYIEDISYWFYLENFKDEICVCNGVKLLKMLGHPANEFAMPFLFDCLKDIQQPYFEDTVTTLSRFPEDILVTEIEHYVSIAHEKEDVLWGAGLIYLSKRIGYTISLSRDKEAETLVKEDSQIFFDLSSEESAVKALNLEESNKLFRESVVQAQQNY